MAMRVGGFTPQDASRIARAVRKAEAGSSVRRARPASQASHFAKILSNDGSGVYSVTLQKWSAADEAMGDVEAVSASGIEAAARDLNGRDSGNVGDICPAWIVRDSENETLVLIDVASGGLVVRDEDDDAVSSVTTLNIDGDGSSIETNITDNGSGEATVVISYSGAGGAYPGAHALLGAEHSDTTTDGPTRGSVIYGNSTPAWDEFTLPSTATLSELLDDVAIAGWSDTDFTSYRLADGTDSPANAQPVAFYLSGGAIYAKVTDANIQAAAGKGVGQDDTFALSVAAVLKYSGNEDKSATIHTGDWRDRGVKLELYPSAGRLTPDTATRLSENVDRDGSGLSASDVQFGAGMWKTDSAAKTTLLTSRRFGDNADSDDVYLELYVDATNGNLIADWVYTNRGSPTAGTVDVYLFLWGWATEKTANCPEANAVAPP
jgi:hypothetical protein